MSRACTWCCIPESRLSTARASDDDEALIVTVRDPLLDAALYGAHNMVLRVERWVPAARYSSAGLFATEQLTPDMQYCCVAKTSYHQTFAGEAASTSERQRQNVYTFDGKVFAFASYTSDGTQWSDVHTESAAVSPEQPDDAHRYILHFWHYDETRIDTNAPPMCSGVCNLDEGVGKSVYRSATTGRLHQITNYNLTGSSGAMHTHVTQYDGAANIHTEYSGTTRAALSFLAYPYSQIFASTDAFVVGTPVTIDARHDLIVRYRRMVAAVQPLAHSPSASSSATFLGRMISGTADLLFGDVLHDEPTPAEPTPAEMPPPPDDALPATPPTFTIDDDDADDEVVSVPIAKST